MIVWKGRFLLARVLLECFGAAQTSSNDAATQLRSRQQSCGSPALQPVRMALLQAEVRSSVLKREAAAFRNQP